MRTLRDIVCLLVAIGSVALAAWQPVADTEAVGAAPTEVVRRAGDRATRPTDRAILAAPRVKA